MDDDDLAGLFMVLVLGACVMAPIVFILLALVA